MSNLPLSRPYVGIHANHSDMTIPDNENDMCYKRITTNLRRWFINLEQVEKVLAAKSLGNTSGGGVTHIPRHISNNVKGSNMFN